MRHSLALALLALGCSSQDGRDVPPIEPDTSTAGAAGAQTIDGPGWSQTFTGSAPLDPEQRPDQHQLGWTTGQSLCPSVSTVLPSGFTGSVRVPISETCQAAGLVAFFASDGAVGPVRLNAPIRTDIGDEATLTVRLLECDAVACRWDYTWAFWL